MFRLFYGLILLFSTQVFATVDGHDRVFVVVQNVQSEEFFLERVPIIGCYGLPQGARLAQFTAPYTATVNIGCGGVAAEENINVLTCAKMVEAKESADFYSFSHITLDISKCEAKNNARFITLVRTAAKYNFPQKNPAKQVQLTLLK